MSHAPPADALPASADAAVAPTSRRSLPSLSRFAPEQIIGERYRLARPLAQGGMAELWIAQHVDLRTEVVVKFLKQTPDADADWAQQALERFRLEAQVTAQLAKQ